MAPGSIFRHSLSHSFHLHYSQIASFFSYASPRSLCTGSSAVERLVYTELVGGSIPSPCILFTISHLGLSALFLLTGALICLRSRHQYLWAFRWDFRLANTINRVPLVCPGFLSLMLSTGALQLFSFVGVINS